MGCARVLFRIICGRGERHRDAEDGTAARALVNRNLTAVHLDRPFGDGQAETGSTARARARRVEPEEAIENPIAMRRRNAGSPIGELEDSLIAVASKANIDR